MSDIRAVESRSGNGTAARVRGDQDGGRSAVNLAGRGGNGNGPRKPGRFAVVAALIVLAGPGGALGAEAIPVPNASFEAPATSYADPRVEAWQETGRPFWYDEGVNGPWDQLTGVFKNTDPDRADHIDNCDGAQALFLFALPEVGLFQDYDSMDYTNTVPTHAFDAKFEVGKSYDLTVGVIGGGGAMTNGVTLEIGLYYRDATNNQVTVAATSITNTPDVFPNTTHFVDFHAHAPTVKAGDAWAGQQIGVRLRSTVDPALMGGYWDVDNVRLTASGGPLLLEPQVTGGQFQFTVQSDPGLKFDVLASTDLTVPLADWTRLGSVTNVSGRVPFIDQAPDPGRRFYGVKQLP